MSSVPFNLSVTFFTQLSLTLNGRINADRPYNKDPGICGWNLSAQEGSVVA